MTFTDRKTEGYSRQSIIYRTIDIDAIYIYINIIGCTVLYKEGT